MRPIMKILKLHNRHAEKALLERYGHEGLTFLEDNAWLDDINSLKVNIAIKLEVQV
jgi:hypothetical protein